MEATPIAHSEEFLQESRHTLFVEGAGADSFDPKVLDALLDSNIRIAPLGPSYSVSSVAEALFAHHPTYYFLIDRDHHDDKFVERCWSNFPDPKTHNLLVWRRREIENYFLDSDYLLQSSYCKVDRGALESKILQFVNKRLFLDAANRAVTSIREELKQNWIENFTNPAEFPNKAAALDKLKDADEFARHRADVERKVSIGEVERRFHKYLDAMTGGRDTVAFRVGDWLHTIQGKNVLSQVIHSNCFQVRAADGSMVTGREKINEVAKDLLRKEERFQPDDFIALKRLINERIMR